MLSLKKQKGIWKLFSQETLEKLSVNKHPDNSAYKYRLFLLVIALFIIALARPVMNEKNLHTQISIPLVVAVDFSKSMQKTDIYPERLTFAKKKLQVLLSCAKTMQIGVIFFTTDAYLAYPISEDIASIQNMMQKANFKQNLGKGTNIFAALQSSTELLKPYKNKNILLLSDGGKKSSFTKEINYLKKNNVTLYALGIGSDNAKTLALGSGGSYKDYNFGANDINVILADLKKKAKYKSKTFSNHKEYTELFRYPLFCALLLLVFISSSFHKQTLILVVLLFQISHSDSHADLLDFIKIQNADESYKKTRYFKAAKIYKTLPENKETLYNIGNALYKAGDYKNALKYYKKGFSHDTKFNAKVLHNIGNCYFKLKRLNLAKKYYEKSFNISKNKKTKENLTITNKILKRMQKRVRSKTDEDKFLSKLTIDQSETGTTFSSNFTVKLEDVVMTEEQRWMHLLQNKNSPIFLRKLKTNKVSSNEEQQF